MTCQTQNERIVPHRLADVDAAHPLTKAEALSVRRPDDSMETEPGALRHPVHA